MSHKTIIAVHFMVMLVVAVLVAGGVCAIADTPPAYALDVAKCTARPNADAGSDVLGGAETRITWEGQADAEESLAGLTLTLPADTTYLLDNMRITMLTGDDLLTRTQIDHTAYAEGQTITIVFSEPAPPGGYFRIELYGVVFPLSGGEMVLVGSYTLADGSTFDMGVIPGITVTGTSPSEALASNLAEQDWVQAWNSNKFLRLFLNPPILVRSFPIVLQGFFMALAIVLVAFPIAIPLGLALSFMRMSRFRILRALASLYVNVVRGTPVFLQIYIAFFGLPLAGIQIPSFPLGVVVLSLNSAAYQCEIFRAGIQSINKGQFEAARSLGMNGAQTMMFVIIPQTVRRVLPTMTNEFILLYKDTSLLAAVGVMEVVMYAKTIVASTGSITPYIVAACFYLVLTLPLAKFVGILEAKLAGADLGSGEKKDKRRKRRSDKGLIDRKLEESGSAEKADTALDISPERFSSM